MADNVLILDGGMGRELARIGAPFRQPEWSALAREVLALLRQIQQETGVAYLFITHDLHVVREVADTVAVLRHGRIVRQGPVTETLSPPLDDYTQQLLLAVPEMRCGWLRDVMEKAC